MEYYRSQNERNLSYVLQNANADYLPSQELGRCAGDKRTFMQHRDKSEESFVGTGKCSKMNSNGDSQAYLFRVPCSLDLLPPNKSMVLRRCLASQRRFGPHIFPMKFSRQHSRSPLRTQRERMYAYLCINKPCALVQRWDRAADMYCYDTNHR